MTGKHWLLIAGFLSATGVAIAGLSSWDEATRPLFIGGLFGQIAAMLGALFAERPHA